MIIVIELLVSAVEWVKAIIIGTEYDVVDEMVAENEIINRE